jgi:hypothetical protein
MALTETQRSAGRLIARNRIESGESYIAGGVALNTLLEAPRVSRGVDLFHDTREALLSTWQSDRTLLEEAGWRVIPVREFPSFVEADVLRGGDGIRMQWSFDSAYRFFPLVEHADFGLVLHPFDLATNKVLALVGRLEVRDWIDVVSCHDNLQPLGYLAWAAAGKDPGLNPVMVLEEASRSSRYTQADLDTLQFEGDTPSARDLSVRWRKILAESREVVGLLPEDRTGTCVLHSDGTLFRAGCESLEAALGEHRVLFRAGSVRGSLPTITGAVGAGT